jgi:hypothetical protein
MKNSRESWIQSTHVGERHHWGFLPLRLGGRNCAMILRLFLSNENRLFRTFSEGYGPE